MLHTNFAIETKHDWALVAPVSQGHACLSYEDGVHRWELRCKWGRTMMGFRCTLEALKTVLETEEEVCNLAMPASFRFGNSKSELNFELYYYQSLVAMGPPYMKEFFCKWAHLEEFLGDDFYGTHSGSIHKMMPHDYFNPEC
jgi:hypothetical protein